MDCFRVLGHLPTEVDNSYELEQMAFERRSQKLHEYLQPSPFLLAANLLRFQRLNSDLAKLRMCDTIFDSLSIVPRDNPECYTRLKSNHVSVYFLAKSRDQFTKLHEPRQTFEYINRALAIARTRPDRCIAYYTRATLYYELNEYAACLHSLDQAQLESDRPIAAMAMRHSCTQMLLLRQGRPPRPLWLTRDPFDVRAQFRRTRDCAMLGTIDGAVQLRQRIDGREQRVVTNHAMHVGTFVGIDRALFPTLVTTAAWSRCAYCHRESLFRLQPCPGCCTTMFCGAECASDAMDEWHQYECALASFLHSHPDLRPVVRLLLQTFRSRADVADMVAVWRRTDYGDVWTEFNFFGLARLHSSRYPHNYAAKLVYALCLHDQYRRPADQEQCFWFARRATYLYRVLLQKTDFVRRFFVTSAHCDFLRIYLYEHLMLLAVYGQQPHRVSSSVRFTDERQDRSDAVVAVFPLWSTLRHSCTPNVIAMPYGTDRLVLITVRPLQPNEELTVDRTHGLYAPVGNVSRHHRTLLFERFRIRCACPANSAALPFPNLQSPRTHQVLPWAGRSLQRLHRETKQTVERQFDETAAFMACLSVDYPCAEWAESLESLELCLERLLGPPIDHDMGRDDFAVAQRRKEEQLLSRGTKEQMRRTELAAAATGGAAATRSEEDSDDEDSERKDSSSDSEPAMRLATVPTFRRRPTMARCRPLAAAAAAVQSAASTSGNMSHPSAVLSLSGQSPAQRSSGVRPPTTLMLQPRNSRPKKRMAPVLQTAL